MRLRELREKRNFLPADVAYALGVSVATYLKYEDGSLELDAKTLLRLAVIFNCTTDEILGLSKKKPAPNPKPSYPRYEIPTDDGESPTRKTKSYFPYFLALCIIIIISMCLCVKFGVIERCSSCADKETSRDIEQNDMTVSQVETYDDAFTHITLQVIAHSDINDLALSFSFYDKDGYPVKTVYNYFGDFKKSERKTYKIAFSEFTWDELRNLSLTYKITIKSGYVPL